MINLFRLLAIAIFLIGPALIAGQDHRYDYDEVLNCARNQSYQVSVVNEATQRTKNGGVLIVFIRPGDGENSRQLTQQRIYNVRRYFEIYGAQPLSGKVIVGEGDKVSGYGRIEYYLGGELFERLLFPRRGFICHSCCGPDMDYYPDKSKTKKRKTSQKYK